ncbi:MAG: class II fructose-bisphosphate aldolase, partial [Clostridia bacterium]|nr:class II fructose-bisphosphate aldolase [Clostridia bacterium]
MPLVKTTDMLATCLKGKYAVGAFNINGLDQPKALIEAAEKIKSPL